MATTFSHGEVFADEHRFQIPEGTDWNGLCERRTGVGAAPQTAIRAIERDIAQF